ncbi:MAG: serine hydrolase domain-containing protein, partial [Pseudomonadota bacterium]
LTGVLTAQFIESGQLELNTRAEDCLPAAIARQLPRKSNYRTSDLTVEHLLHHRGGFDDFATSEAWFQEIAADPGRFRPPEDIAQWALAHVHLQGEPGQTYCYSDTGYVLLGLILEHIGGSTYAELCRRGIFDTLAMGETWLEGHEKPRSTLSHPRVSLGDESTDALLINGSCDWAGGGHVSTLGDLDRFLHGLTSGLLFKNAATLDLVLRGQHVRDNFFYGMGIGRKQLRGLNLWGHLGHWGSFMYYCPEQRMTLAGTLNYDGAEHNEFITAILQILFPD